MEARLRDWAMMAAGWCTGSGVRMRSQRLMSSKSRKSRVAAMLSREKNLVTCRRQPGEGSTQECRQAGRQVRP